MNLSTIKVFNLYLNFVLLIANLCCIPINALVIKFRNIYISKHHIFVHKFGYFIGFSNVFPDIFHFLSNLIDILITSKLGFICLSLLCNSLKMSILLLLHLFFNHFEFDLLFLHFKPNSFLLLILNNPSFI